MYFACQRLWRKLMVQFDSKNSSNKRFNMLRNARLFLIDWQLVDITPSRRRRRRHQMTTTMLRWKIETSLAHLNATRGFHFVEKKKNEKNAFWCLSIEHNVEAGGSPGLVVHWRRLLYRRTWVWIPAQNTVWTFFTFICCLNWIVILFETAEIERKSCL